MTVALPFISYDSSALAKRYLITFMSINSIRHALLVFRASRQGVMHFVTFVMDSLLLRIYYTV